MFLSALICNVSFLTQIAAYFYILKITIFLNRVLHSKILISLTVEYFRGEESVGERSTCIVMAFIYLLAAMMVLIVDESTLEIGLEDAYDTFNKSASVFLSRQGLSSS